MKENNNTMEDIARLLLMTRAAVSQRFRNHTQWRLEEMYMLMDRYNLLYERLHEYFPKDGRKAV